MVKKIYKETNVSSNNSQNVMGFLRLLGEELIVICAVLLLSFFFMDSGLDFAWFHDPVALTTICAMVLLMLAITGLFSDFLHAFTYSAQKQKEVAALQLKRSLLSVKLAMITAIVTLVFALAFNFVSLMTSVSYDIPSALTAGLAVWGGSSFYGILIVFLLLPVYASLKIRLLSQET